KRNCREDPNENPQGTELLHIGVGEKRTSNDQNKRSDPQGLDFIAIDVVVLCLRIAHCGKPDDVTEYDQHRYHPGPKGDILCQFIPRCVLFCHGYQLVYLFHFSKYKRLSEL